MARLSLAVLSPRLKVSQSCSNAMHCWATETLLASALCHDASTSNLINLWRCSFA